MIRFSEAVIGDAEREAVLRVLDSGRLTMGDVCAEFEAELTRLTSYSCHVVSSGTAALHVALLAAGVKPGDCVVVPATTYVATANAVKYCGAEPVVVDVDPKSWTIDFAAAVEAAERHEASAIIPVHLYGNPASSFIDWRDDYYRRTGRLVRIVEDAAESLGCLRSGVAPCGDLACLSFYGSKTITTGEGGAVLWRDPLLGRRVVHLAGQAVTTERYLHDAVGYNYRMTDVAAAIGIAQLSRLPELLERRRQVFAWYNEHLPETFRRQDVGKDDTHGCWAFAAHHPFRPVLDAKRLIHHLAQMGIEARPVFPPLPANPHLAGDSSTRGLMTALSLHEHGVVFPTHPLLTEEQVKRVCDTAEGFLWSQ